MPLGRLQRFYQSFGKNYKDMENQDADDGADPVYYSDQEQSDKYWDCEYNPYYWIFLYGG